MSTHDPAPLTPEELANEGVTALPDKEVISILDLAADVDLAIDGAAPIDLAVALNANVAAPIDAAVSANLLSDGSSAQTLSDQGVQVTQTVEADAIATGVQDSTIDQSDTTAPATAPGGTTAAEGAMLTATTQADDATAGDALAGAAAAGGPVDGSVVVDAAGNVVGLLDTDTGNVVDADGNVVGTLNETTGVVVDAAGNLVGTVTDLVNGASVIGSDGQVLGVLDALTGNVVDASGTVVGTLDPLTGEVLDAAGNLVGTVGEVLDDVTDTVGGLDTGDLLKGDLLNVDVNVDLDADLAAPINGAVAANANVAAPIDASVAANILSDDSQATAIAQQDAIITQTITGSAEATSEQVSSIDQASVEPVDSDTATASADDAFADPAAVPQPVLDAEDDLGGVGTDPVTPEPVAAGGTDGVDGDTTP